MGYVGIQTQQRRNNLHSTVMLLSFPVMVLAAAYFVCLGYSWFLVTDGYYTGELSIYEMANIYFVPVIPYVLIGVAVWFLIAYFNNTSMIRSMTHARPLERRENPRIYNLVENLCMSQGMPMPKINIVDDDDMNAFASGIDKKTYTVTLTSGIIEALDDDELEGVIAHELCHIRNRDVRMLIVSIVFVGIFAILMQVAYYMLVFGGRRSNSKDNGSVKILALAVIIVSAICYLFTLLMRFSISRKREFMADAGATEMTKKPLALASALRKISARPGLEDVASSDVAQLYIFSNKSFAGLFETHPPIEERIRILEQF